MGSKLRYLSTSTLVTAYAEMGGSAGEEVVDELRAVLVEAEQAGLHACAATLLAELLRREVVGRWSEELALVATELFYNRNGWTVIGRDRFLVDEFLRRGGDPTVALADLSRQLAAAAQPLPTPD